MGKRTDTTDIIAMALLYRNECCKTGMILYEKALEFDKVINENLDLMNDLYGLGIMGKTDNRLFFTATNEEGELYAIIKPDADIEEARRWHIRCLPLEVVVASQMPNALDVIGLELVNGELKEKENKIDIKKLIHKMK